MGPSIFDVNRSIAEKAAADERFRSLMSTDPKAGTAQVMSELVGRKVDLPADVKITVHPYTANDIHLILPEAEASPAKSLEEGDLKTLGYIYSPTYIKCE